MKKTTSGFTIVELLIVIIVIGILATISMVAYNGAQTRAENTKSINAATAYVKVFTLYAAEKGLYPTVTVDSCLGGGWMGSCGLVTSGSPVCGYASATSVNTTLNTQLAEYTSSFPAASTQIMTCKGETYKGVYVLANSTNTRNLYLVMFLKTGVSCPLSLGTAKTVTNLVSDQTQACMYAMPTLST